MLNTHTGFRLMAKKSADIDNKAAGNNATVHDRSNRRSFIRQGSALLLAGATIPMSSSPYAQDCDQARYSEENENCADADAGEESDPAICGCEKPKISISKLHDAPEGDVSAVGVEAQGGIKFKRIKA